MMDDDRDIFSVDFLFGFGRFSRGIPRFEVRACWAPCEAS